MDLFDAADPAGARLELAPGAAVLRGFATHEARGLLDAVEAIARAAPFRRMETPGGLRMSVAMTNCGALGWVTDRRGYRYDAVDPLSGAPWPPLPDAFRRIAQGAASAAGFAAFDPDACLVNRYEPGARLSLHQDADERDFGQPIVSVSLGLPATFLFGGLRRADKAQRIALRHGDVVVWGGPSRMRYHGVLALKPPDADADASAGGAQRINLTFRKAG